VACWRRRWRGSQLHATPRGPTPSRQNHYSARNIRCLEAPEPQRAGAARLHETHVVARVGRRRAGPASRDRGHRGKARTAGPELLLTMATGRLRPYTPQGRHVPRLSRAAALHPASSALANHLERYVPRRVTPMPPDAVRPSGHPTSVRRQGERPPVANRSTGNPLATSLAGWACKEVTDRPVEVEQTQPAE